MKKILTKNALSFAMILGAAAAIVISAFSSFAEDCEDVSANVLRLHIIAASDSEADQAFKYALRDDILAKFSERLKDCATLEVARERSLELLPEIEEEANRFAEAYAIENGGENGEAVYYPVTASLTDMYFTTRVYENITIPAGNYSALRLVIGSGEGKNWWCVMFPPLCLPAVSENNEDLEASTPYFTEAVSKQIEKSEKPQVKFAVYEWISGLFKK